jgi:glycosyltransferase involved in cell wall biosynthesis
MIVKNEEQNLKKCLSEVSNLVEEIIIVDTGSTDNTKNIALEFTNKIYDYTWCDDFAAARNFSISKATSDWILVLDADEYISEFSMERIECFINDRKNEKTVGRIERINILEDGSGEKRYIERISRLFNKRYFQYEGSIHEQIVSKDGAEHNTTYVDITACHIGYTKEVINKTNKLKRNKDMLIKAIGNSPNDPYLHFQLGKTNYMMKNYIDSCSCFERALSFKLDSRLEYVEDLMETYGYALINSNRFLDAMNLENYLELYRNSADFHFLLGLIYMNNAKFNESVESFLKCTKFSHGKMEGITTYLPYYNIGIIYEVLGYNEQALEYYKLCGEYSLAVERLHKLTR